MPAAASQAPVRPVSVPQTTQQPATQASAGQTAASTARSAGPLPLHPLIQPEGGAVPLPSPAFRPPREVTARTEVPNTMKSAQLGIKAPDHPPSSGTPPTEGSTAAAPASSPAAEIRPLNLVRALQEVVLNQSGTQAGTPVKEANALGTLLHEVRLMQLAQGTPDAPSHLLSLPLIFPDGTAGQLTIRREGGRSPTSGQPGKPADPDQARVALELDMSHLGPVHVDLLLANSQVNARIEVGDAGTEAFLADHLDELATGLREAGVVVNALSLHARPSTPAPRTGTGPLPTDVSTEPTSSVDLRL